MDINGQAFSTTQDWIDAHDEEVYALGKMFEAEFSSMEDYGDEA